MSLSWNKKPDRGLIDWVGRTGLLFSERDLQPPEGLPTDADLDAVCVAAGFHECLGKPYRRHLRVVSDG